MAAKKNKNPKSAKKTVNKQSAKKVVRKTTSKPASKPVAKKKTVKKAVTIAKKGPAKTASRPAVSKTKVKPEGKKPGLPVVAKHPAQKHEDNRSRYSDKELNEFKLLINEKLEAARKELKYLQDQINRKDDNGTDDTENKFGSIEDGSVAMEREYLNQMASRQAAYIDHLDKALLRIQNKTYGICRVTGKLIDKERLRAVPHATLSIEAKMMQSKS